MWWFLNYLTAVVIALVGLEMLFGSSPVFGMVLMVASALYAYVVREKTRAIAHLRNAFESLASERGLRRLPPHHLPDGLARSSLLTRARHGSRFWGSGSRIAGYVMGRDMVGTVEPKRYLLARPRPSDGQRALLYFRSELSTELAEEIGGPEDQIVDGVRVAIPRGFPLPDNLHPETKRLASLASELTCVEVADDWHIVWLFDWGCSDENCDRAHDVLDSEAFERAAGALWHNEGRAL